MPVSPSTFLLHPDHRDPRESDATRAARADTPEGRPIAPLLDRSSIHTLDGAGGRALAAGEDLRHHDVYGRFGTSTGRTAAALVARLEGGEAAMLTSSGMAAITTVLTTMIPPGGRLACAELVYGGTEVALDQTLGARGIEVVRFDPQAPPSLTRLLEDRPLDLVWCESIANPLLQPACVAELAAACERAAVPLAVDATFAGGMAQHPLALGASVVVHSATKFLNGHSDVIAGVIVSDAPTVDRCFATLAHTGCCLDPQAAWLLARGLRTLALRWPRQVASASLLAARLAAHPAVARVYHPSLAPAAMAAAPLDDPGAVLAFELSDDRSEVLDRVLAKLELVTHATSLGGLETLACVPARTSHANVDADKRRARGIGDALVRVSVGIEDPEELWADLAAALA